MKYESINWVFVIALLNFIIYSFQLLLSGKKTGKWHKNITGFLIFFTFFGYVYFLASIGSYTLNLIAIDSGLKKEIVIISLLGFPLGGIIGKLLMDREMRGNISWNNNAIKSFYFRVFVNPLISFLTVLVIFILYALIRR